VLAQPDRFAWNIFDQRLHELGQTFPDYREAVTSGAVHKAEGIDCLAHLTGLPLDGLADTLAEATRLANGQDQDPFPRIYRQTIAATTLLRGQGNRCIVSHTVRTGGRPHGESIETRSDPASQPVCRRRRRLWRLGIRRLGLPVRQRTTHRSCPQTSGW